MRPAPLAGRRPSFFVGGVTVWEWIEGFWTNASTQLLSGFLCFVAYRFWRRFERVAASVEQLPRAYQSIDANRAVGGAVMECVSKSCAVCGDADGCALDDARKRWGRANFLVGDPKPA